MGYLILGQAIKVLMGDQAREYRVGVNKDVTPEEAEHWYVKAAGGQYVEKLEDAHRAAPSAREEATRMRAEWESAQRAALSAAISAQSLRLDLERVEKEFGVDTSAADAAFSASMQEQVDRLREMQEQAEGAAAEQVSQNESSGITPARAEVIAAGSAEVANTTMDGPAKAEALVEAARTAENLAGSEEKPKTTLKK